MKTYMLECDELVAIEQRFEEPTHIRHSISPLTLVLRSKDIVEEISQTT